MKKTKSSQKYPNALKRKIAQEYLSGKFSYAVAAEEYGLANRGVVKEFVKWYKKKEYLSSMSVDKGSKNQLPESAASLPDNLQDATRRIQELEKQIALAKLQVNSLEALIDLAEQELSIDIRKKSGTKLSK